MSKLFLKHNNIDVSIAEIGMISAKEQMVFGNFDRDLILRTSGNVKIQVGNKFYDLLNIEEDSNNVTPSDSVIILQNDSDLAGIPIPNDGIFIYITESNSLYVVSGGEYKLIYSPEDQSGSVDKKYLSYEETQSLTGDNRKIVALNLLNTVDAYTDLLTLNKTLLYEGQVIFVKDVSKHYSYLGGETYDESSWKELYLSLSGGTITGLVNANGNLIVLSNNVSQDYNPVTFNGFSVLDSTGVGLNIWNSENISNVGINSQQLYLFTGINNQESISNPVIIGGNTVGIGGNIDYNYQLSVFGKSLLEEAVIKYNISSENYSPGPLGQGFSIYGSTEKTLEIDNLIVRNNSSLPRTSKFEVKGTDGSYISGNLLTITSSTINDELTMYLNKEKVAGWYSNGEPSYLKDREYYYQDLDVNGDLILKESIIFGDRDSSGNLASYTLYNKVDGDFGEELVIPDGKYSYDPLQGSFVEDENGDLVEISIFDYTIATISNNIQVNDILYYESWDSNENKTLGKYAIVYEKNNTELKVYSLGEIIVGDIFIHLNGNFIEFNDDSLVAKNKVDSLRDVINYVYYDVNDDYNSFNLVINSIPYHKLDKNLIIGPIPSELNPDLDIPNGAKGLYSDSAYIKGNFVADRLMVGNQLEWDGATLNIVDLETIKARTITGSNGLEGGGVLFNSDLIISHSAGTWTNKTNLTGNTVISNLSVDTYGHLTNWTTRTINSTDIPNSSGVTGTSITDALNNLNSAKPENDGTGANGTWDIDINGKSNDSTEWDSLPRTLGETIESDIGYLQVLNTSANNSGYADKANIQTWLGLDDIVPNIPVGTPLSNDTGVVGEVKQDSDYLYVCVATDSWKRISLNNY